MTGWVRMAALIVAILPHITGVASWYDWKPREAAAGPALRAMLGPDWRGQTVYVSRRICTEAGCLTRTVRVRLTDTCACYGSRVIDLDRETFRLLASPSLGLVRVSVRPAP
jgi:hypothetical protein